jgi:hypothetical protein
VDRKRGLKKKRKKGKPFSYSSSLEEVKVHLSIVGLAQRPKRVDDQEMRRTLEHHLAKENK